ncbi:MAG: hypothetical protein GOVbin2277_6 [Prokaryotic dsDNA virus sp.]|mgnify:CR=1 FL=1|jgi:hypothetical protein|nr:MAG: hypothetical protein GOVbin2277_6 [Prokaryotic dsDNA virus sp.]|tara:strand:- start:2678 stop:2902 length:225 start_codon:yes stop_codon:yes gene_type:complete
MKKFQVSQLKWAGTVYVETADVSITVQDNYVDVEVQDFECDAEVVIDLDWLKELNDDELRWLIKQSREIILVRE